MKRALQQIALRLPFIGSVVAKRSVWRIRLRTLLHPTKGPSDRILDPLFVAHDRQSFFEASARARLSELPQRDSEMLRAHRRGSFYLRRFCLCCNETTPMLVDYRFSYQQEDGSPTPNWRETLVCAGCGMNNRQRLVAKLVQQAALQFTHPRVYLMEQVTPIFEWVRRLGGIEALGSEYLGYEHKGGKVIHGVRHEDVMNLSYADASFDLIVSNDVLEHIPDPASALRECRRVLKPGGAVLATFPFHVRSDTTVARARLVGNEVEHLLAPQYHGNPMSSDGSLVFHDFGWDLLDVMRGVGFSRATCEAYSSEEFGHPGQGLLVFRLEKSGSIPTP
jgi:SAM-dependent methyltransferase